MPHLRCLFLLPLLLLAGCGFHLRGAYVLPFDSIYVALPENNDLRATLKRNLQAATGVKVSDTAATAAATLRVLADNQQKNILSIGSDGRVREYQLVRSFSFRVDDKAGRALLAPSAIVLRRDVTFNDSAVLSKEAEDNLLWRDIQDDLVQQVLRRLAAAKPPAHID